MATEKRIRPYSTDSDFTFTSFSGQIPSRELESTEFSFSSQPLDLNLEDQFIPVPRSRALTKPSQLSLVRVAHEVDVRPEFPLHGNPQPRPFEESRIPYMIEELVEHIQEATRPVTGTAELVGNGIIFMTTLVGLASTFVGSEFVKSKPGRRVGRDAMRLMQHILVKS